MSVFQSTWFGKKKLLQPLSAPGIGICSQLKNRACAVLALKMAVCGKCETSELIKWTIPGLYFIYHQEVHQIVENGFQEGLVSGAVLRFVDYS